MVDPRAMPDLLAVKSSLTRTVAGVLTEAVPSLVRTTAKSIAPLPTLDGGSPNP